MTIDVEEWRGHIAAQYIGPIEIHPSDRLVLIEKLCKIVYQSDEIPEIVLISRGSLESILEYVEELADGLYTADIGEFSIIVVGNEFCHPGMMYVGTGKFLVDFMMLTEREWEMGLFPFNTRGWRR